MMHEIAELTNHEMTEIQSDIAQSQEERILHLLKTGRRLTGLAALELVGCFRLAARIHHLREQGHNIASGTIKLPNGKRVSAYWLA